MDNAPICFDDWEHALRMPVPANRRHAYHEAIVKFRYWLRKTGKLPDAETFREHLKWKKSYMAPDRFAIRREALRWYYQKGSLRMKAAGQEKARPDPNRAGHRLMFALRPSYARQSELREGGSARARLREAPPA